MKKGNIKRICAGMLAAVLALSQVPVNAWEEATGNDGSAAMNEAYEDRQSLMPVGPSFNIDTLLEWTPECDPDARYNRASIPLSDRVGGFVVNPKANPAAKLMLCSLANSEHDRTGAQGTENFLSWSFNYWQYTDSFVYWAGSEEGLVVCPTGEFTDAAHTNGVPVVATLGFPFGNGTGYAAQVSAFCRKADDGSFPVADKLLEVMEYYGFDGYFFNQESQGCSPEVARRLNEMMRYMRQKCPDILLSWYDSMVESGGVNYGNAVNSENSFWMEKDDQGLYGIDEFFMNYDWRQGQISTTLNTMNAIGRSPFDAFAGLDVQQNCMDTVFRDHLLLDANGRLKLSLALYCSNSTLGLSTDGAAFHEVEQDFYTNLASDPRLETSDPTDASNGAWVGMSRFFADKTPITGAPFVTNFNSGHGLGYWVEGVLSRNRQWSYQSVQDVMPTWTWIIDSEGAKLSGGYDFTDAYNGGNSIRFYGALDANRPNHIMLYSTHVAVAEGMQLSLTYKQTGGSVKLVAYYGDENTESYDACEKVAYDLTVGSADTWTTTAVDISGEAGKTLYALGIEVASDMDAADFQVNLGQLAILDRQRDALTAPESAKLDEILYRDAFTAEVRLYWSAVAGAASYEVYKLHADGSRSLLMETPNTALYLPTVERSEAEENVTLLVVPINENGIRGEGKELTIDWIHGNDASERNVAVEMENVCLNAEITGVSFENSGEPASKALDGTSANNSKWCATNKSTGWMNIDVGREVTVRRWRVEHAEYGGEANNMNTLDFALEYKDADGKWVQAMRIRNNHDAVTDVLLEDPVTARYWRLRVYDDGSSAWGGIRIYEWQMFETDRFPQTEPVMMHFASAVNRPKAYDSFTLHHVPAGQTVTLYTKNGDSYGQIAQQVADGNAVTFDSLDFGTAEAGRIYYTTTAAGCEESIKMSAAFEAENAPVSAPVSAVYFNRYSQPGSDTYIRGDMAYATVTFDNLAPGDVVYLYEDNSGMWSKCSLPVAPGETSAVIERVRIPQLGGQLTLRVKRVGEQISDQYDVTTPAMGVPMGTIAFYVNDGYQKPLAGVTYRITSEEDAEFEVAVTTAEDGTASVQVPLGTYRVRPKVPDGYDSYDYGWLTIQVLEEGKTYLVEEKYSLKPKPEIVFISVDPIDAELKPGDTLQFSAAVEGENLMDSSVSWSVSGGTSADTKIDENGLLTVGEDETSDDLIVTATSVQDPTQSITAIVMLLPGEPVDTAPTVPATSAPAGNAGGEQGSAWIVWVLVAAVVAAAAVIVVIILKKRTRT